MRDLLLVSISLGLLLLTFVFLNFRPTGATVPLKKPLANFPSAIGLWTKNSTSSLDKEVLDLLRTEDYLIRSYVDRNARIVELFIGYWDRQTKGASIHSPKNCLPGSGWIPLSSANLTISVPASRTPIEVNSYLVEKNGNRRLVFYWYQMQRKAVAGEVRARLEMIRNSIFYNRTDEALIRISSPIYGNAEDTSAMLVEYVQAMYPALLSFLI